MLLKISSLKNNQFALAAFFLLLGLFSLAGLCLVNKQILLKTAYDPHFLKLPDNITTVITGASDMQFGLNPDLIKNACNIARPAENYFYAYYKLKFLLNSRNKIKNIVIGYTVGSLSLNRENDLTGPVSGQFYKLYFMLLDRYGVNKLYPRNKSFYFFYAKYGIGMPIEMQQELSILYNILFDHSSLYDYPFSGTFVSRESDKNFDLQFFIRAYYLDAFVGKDAAIVPESRLMFEYLEKIVQLCRDKGVALILLSTPVHKSFLQQVPPYYSRLFYHKIEALKAAHPHIQHYDYTTYNLSDDCFIDVIHLNSKGNDLFSKEINRLLAADAAP